MHDLASPYQTAPGPFINSIITVENICAPFNDMPPYSCTHLVSKSILDIVSSGKRARGTETLEMS